MNDNDLGESVGRSQAEAAWERFLIAEQRGLVARAEGILARALLKELPEESREELDRWAEEDQRLAREGMVELMDEQGESYHKHIDQLKRLDVADRLKAETVRSEWLARRTRERIGRLQARWLLGGGLTQRRKSPISRLEVVREGTSVAKKPLGLVWVLSPSYSITTVGLKKALEGMAEVKIGGESLARSPSCVVFYAGGMEEGGLEGMGHIRERYPGVPLLVLGSQLDLALAWAALKNGADGFVHAMMHPSQMLRAVEVVQKGELAAPRQLLGYFLNQKENPKIGILSARQREILELVVEGLSNAQIAGRLYLSESTIKQHLRAAYKVLGVSNRTEAAKAMREHA